jgi:hypothetical protein
VRPRSAWNATPCDTPTWPATWPASRSATTTSAATSAATPASRPADIATLCRQVGDNPGADLRRLIAALTPDPDTAEQALRQLIAQAEAQAAERPPEQR